MDLAKVNWSISKELQDEWGGMKIRCATADVIFHDVQDAVGVDPGKNFGLGFLWDGMLTTFWATLPTQEHDYEYFGFIQKFMLDWFPKDNPANVAMVEGPSYASLYRQPFLEDCRLGFLMSLQMLGKEVSYVAPQSVRKTVFGNGRIKAANVWYDLTGKAANGADAAAVALFAGGYKYNE